MDTAPNKLGYLEWLARIQPGDMIHVGDRNGTCVYYWPVSDVEDGIIYANEFEFEAENGFGPPGKILYPTDRVKKRFANQGMAEKIASMTQQGDLTHLSRESLLEIHDLIMDKYDEARHWPRGLKERESRYSGKPRDRRRSAGGDSFQ